MRSPFCVGCAVCQAGLRTRVSLSSCSAPAHPFHQKCIWGRGWGDWIKEVKNIYADSMGTDNRGVKAKGGG